MLTGITTGNVTTSIYTDNLGNLTNDGTWTYTWKNGRQLATMSKSGTTWNFFYDASGMRTQRSNGSTTYTYTYDGGKLTQMKMGSSTMRFTYGINGHPVSLNYDGIVYYYVTNAQGDVVAILNSSGQEVVSYTYDACGNTVKRSGSKADTLGLHNPLRYRGYVYDRETGLYYLQSRYYNPTVGRFINADTFVSTGQGILGNNMFAYCNNNPVSRIDISGAASISVTNFDETPWDDMINDNLGMGGSGGGGSFFNSVMRTLQSAADGLNMAMGSRDMSRTQDHHIFSDKSKVYTPQYKEIMDRYDMALNNDLNIVSLKGHYGRHTNASHQFMLCSLITLDYMAAGNKMLFFEGMRAIKAFVSENPGLPYAK